MTVMADYAPYQRPARRPVGNMPAAGPPMTKPPQQFPQAQMLQQQQQQQQRQQQQPFSPTHYHSRTASSAIFSPSAPHPSAYSNQPPMPGGLPAQQAHAHQQSHSYASHPVRRMTNSTVSSQESNPKSHAHHGHLAAAPVPGQGHALPYHSASNKSSNTNLRRSTSSRSQASSLGPSSYVALLRKQKATVWCDRTQLTDPRATAQAKAAKQRAAHEILTQSQGRNSMALSTAATAASSGGILSSRKKPNAKGAGGSGGGAGANLAAGVGVPMRLSASEVGDEESDVEDGVYSGGAGGVHRRTNSGKSSLTGAGQGGQNRLNAPRTNTRLSYGSGISGKAASSSGQVSPGEQSGSQPPPPLEHRGSTGSTDSEERREKEIGGVGDMLAPSAAETQEGKRLNKDELSRRGSVDERSATMRGAAGAMRLFVANPDADDSD